MRITPQFFYLLAILVLIIYYFYRNFYRLQNLRLELEKQWNEIEKHLKIREKKIPFLEEWIRQSKINDNRVNDALKSITFIHNNVHYDYQLQQQKVSNQLRNLFRYLEPHAISDDKFLDIKKILFIIDNDIQVTSNTFNQSVEFYNNKLINFPTSWISQQLGFYEAEFFKLQPIK